jgi:uncharacterized phosphosugar-binding protein
VTNTKKYLNALINTLSQLEQEENNIAKAAEILAKATEKDELIHIMGTEPHTAMLEDEIFFKGGGLANINPIYDPAFELSHGAYRSALCQSLMGLTPCILGYYENIESGEPIIFLTSEVSSMLFTEAVQWAKKKGLTIIAIVTRMEDEAFAAKDLIDVIIDTHIMKNNEPAEIGKVHTACVSALLNLLVTETLRRLQNPSKWRGKVLASEVENKELIDRYIYRIKHL